jgi:hypothetical protein
LDILDLTSVPKTPLLAELPGSGRFASTVERAIAKNGETVYVWHYRSGFGNEVLTVDVSDPSNPIVLGSIPLLATDFQFTGQHVHVANPNSNYTIYDANDPNAWIVIGEIEGIRPWDIEIRDNTAYLANATSTFSIIDISDPTNPSVIGSHYAGMNGYSVEVGSDIAFVIGSFDHELIIIDTSDLGNPTEIAEFILPMGAYDIELVGDMLYAVGYQDLCAIDVSSPALPVVTSVVPLLGLPQYSNIHHEDGVLFAGGSDLVTLDLANPEHPVVSGWYGPSNVISARTEWMEIASSNGLAYINAGAGGLQIIDVSGPCSVPCLPDTNNDGTLSPADFSAWVAAFNTQAPACDQNDDGSCTPADFSAWVTNYNAGCP